MPPAPGKKRSEAQKLALIKARENILAMRKPEHATVESLTDELASTQDELHAAEQALHATELEHKMQKLMLENTQNQLHAEYSKNKELYQTLCTTKCTLQRTRDSKLKLQDKINLLKNVNVHDAAKNAAAALKCLEVAKQEKTEIEENLSTIIDNLMDELETVKDKLEKTQKKAHALNMQQC